MSRAFSWLLYSHEVFTPEVFLLAVLVIEPGCQVQNLTISQLCDMCCNLIMVDKKINAVRFAYSLVQEYLESKPQFTLQRTNSSAILSCLEAYISYPVSSFNTGLHMSENFSYYVSVYWPEYCRSASNSPDSPETDGKVEEFVFDGDLVSLTFYGWLNDAR